MERLGGVEAEVQAVADGLGAVDGGDGILPDGALLDGAGSWFRCAKVDGRRAA